MMHHEGRRIFALAETGETFEAATSLPEILEVELFCQV